MPDDFDDLGDSVEKELFDLEGPDDDVGEEQKRLNADSLLDRVIPDQIDWRDLVRRFPLISIGAAAGLGFLLGRARGGAIVAGVSVGLTNAVMRQLSDVFEGEVFEF